MEIFILVTGLPIKFMKWIGWEILSITGHSPDLDFITMYRKNPMAIF